jgi:hypothetical protein
MQNPIGRPLASATACSLVFVPPVLRGNDPPDHFLTLRTPPDLAPAPRLSGNPLDTVVPAPQRGDASCCGRCVTVMPRAQTETHLVSRIGWLRAGVLGANDGILSTASLIVGVASASGDKRAVLVAGLAGPVAGRCRGRRPCRKPECCRA